MSIMPQERFKTWQVWEGSMQGKNKEVMSIKDDKLKLWRPEGKKLNSFFSIL